MGNGNFGIGTDAPTATLAVTGTASIGGATNKLTISTDGTLTLNGTATVFDDLTGDITRTKTAGTR
ncbi:hypothetical protein, partial [Limosilactobacillus reuteri]|uniref:hypothetical protein n=1 Tax=Limosilactobacillus reuteri TaxID=1598 RepID=UPI00207C3233